MRAMLIWSNGFETNTIIFNDENGKTGLERARQQMFAEYDSHNCNGDADENLGAIKSTDYCIFAAEEQEPCRWDIRILDK